MTHPPDPQPLSAEEYHKATNAATRIVAMQDADYDHPSFKFVEVKASITSMELKLSKALLVAQATVAQLTAERDDLLKMYNLTQRDYADCMEGRANWKARAERAEAERDAALANALPAECVATCRMCGKNAAWYGPNCEAANCPLMRRLKAVISAAAKTTQEPT